MKLIKTTENSNRNFDTEGNVSYRSESANYTINDEDGNSIANASVNIDNDYGNVTINFSNICSLEAGEEKLKEVFGI